MTNNPTFQINDRVSVTSIGDFDGKISRVIGHTKVRIIVKNANLYLEGRSFKPENLVKVTETTTQNKDAIMCDELEEHYNWSQE
jgi:hypothetical protein